MGDDQSNSAVHTHMQLLDMDNLFVCCASAFPHFGPTNPTATVGAVTYRATEGMIKYLKEGAGLLI